MDKSSKFNGVNRNLIIFTLLRGEVPVTGEYTR